MAWQHLVSAAAGFLALLSQHWWERRREKARAEGREYIRFDYPVAITLFSLIVPGVFEYQNPEMSALWWSWVAGAAVVAVPGAFSRFWKRRMSGTLDQTGRE